MNKWLIGCLIFLCFGFTGKLYKNRDFKLISAEMQTSYGGAAGSGSVSTYTIRLKARRNFEIQCDSGYGAGRRAELYIKVDSIQLASSRRIKRGQTVTMTFSIRDEVYVGGGDFQMVIPGSDSSAAPGGTKTGVSIKYRGGKSSTMAINKLSISTPIFAP